MSWSTMRLLELNFVWLHKDQVFFPQRAPQILKKQILVEHCYSLRKSSKPHENVGISKDAIAFYWARILPEMFVVVEREAWTWSNCVGGSLTLLFYFWTVQRQEKSSAVVFLYALPSFIIYISNFLSMEIQAHRSCTIFIVGFLICLNEGFPTNSELTGTKAIVHNQLYL